MSYSSGATRSAHTRWPKLWVLQTMGKKVSYFLKQKIARIQAKLFCVQFFLVEFFNIEQRGYQTLFWK